MEAECRECGYQFEVDPDDNEYICPECLGMDVRTNSDGEESL